MKIIKLPLCVVKQQKLFKLYKNNLDVIDYIIIEYLKYWHFYSHRYSYGQKYFKIIKEKKFISLSLNVLKENLPLINIKSKTGLSLRIKKLKDLDIIRTVVKRKLYVRFSNKFIKLYFGKKFFRKFRKFEKQYILTVEKYFKRKKK